jgi:hypothetical protein
MVQAVARPNHPRLIRIDLWWVGGVALKPIAGALRRGGGICSCGFLTTDEHEWTRMA